MADAFSGVPLTVIPGSIQRSAPVVYSKRVIPGGGDTYIDVAGVPNDHIVLPLFVKQLNDLNTLRALKGNTGALTYGTGAPGGAVSITLALLVDVYPMDTAPLGEQHAAAEFEVIAP